MSETRGVPIADVVSVGFEVVRPLEPLSPAVFAERHRVVAGGPFAGQWDNENGPHLVPIMEAVEEAINTGRHLVVIKGAQEGVTDALGVNAVAWLLTYFPGSVLYLTSKAEVAEELVHDRWEGVLRTCEPLRKKHLGGKANSEKINVKRFTDAKLTLSSSASLLNFLSQPFAIVVFDELDACVDEMQDGSDPIAIVLERLTAYAEGRPVLLIAFAHPTTKLRGAAKLYYAESDQRRSHVACPHCGEWCAPLWKDIKFFPAEGEAPAAAERIPERYEFVAPCCGATWTDADRLKAIRHVEQRSTLEPEVAKTKGWIGLHVWHFFLRKAGRVPALAAKHIAGLEDEGKAVVFTNKVTGDAVVLEDDSQADEEAWRGCITLPRFDGDRASYYRGEVPAEASFLTAGTDASKEALHWTVWAWGMLDVQAATRGTRVLCGWLVDWGVLERVPPENTLDAADLRPFDALLYDRTWARTDGKKLAITACGHDSGWEPTAVYAYADKRPGRAVAVKGGADDQSSVAPLLRWGKKPTRLVKTVEVKWIDDRLGILNTWVAKRMLHARVRRRFAWAPPGGTVEPVRWRIHLPIDVEDEIVGHLAAERLIRKGKKLVWQRTGPNHYGDCSVYAFVLAESGATAQRERTARELDQRADERKAADERRAVPRREGEREGKRSWKIGR